MDPVDQQGDTFDSVILFEDHFLLAVPSAPNFFASMGIKKDFLRAAFTADEIRRGVHLDPAAPSVSLSSFAKAPFLLLRPETIAYERAVKLCSQNGFAPNIRLQLDQLATAYRSCGAGLGVTLLSDTVVRMSDHDEPVVFYKLDSDDVSRDIAVMWKKKRDMYQRLWRNLRSWRQEDVFRLNTYNVLNRPYIFFTFLFKLLNQ